MIISNWRVKNFKSLVDTSLDIRPINVLVGRNSIGKSSLIQSILALAQMADEQLPDTHVSVVGFSQDLGSADSVIHSNRAGERAKFVEFELQGKAPQRGFESGTRDFTYRMFLKPESDSSGLFKIESEELETSSCRGLIFTRTSRNLNLNRGIESEVSMTLNGARHDRVISMKWGRQRQIISSLHDARVAQWLAVLWKLNEERVVSSRVAFDEGRRTPASFSRAKDETYKSFGPLLIRFLNETQGRSSVNGERILGNLLEGDHDRIRIKISELDFEDAIGHLKDQFVSGNLSDLFGAGMSSRDLVSWIGFSVFDIQVASQLANSILYLGPLRVVLPRDQRNQKSPSAIIPIGGAGEFLANYLVNNASKPGNFIYPDGTKHKSSLEEGINAWLAFLGLAGKVKSNLISGITSTVTVGDRMLSQIGSGVSQVLPVVVISLLAGDRREPLVLLEQPELHLHPNLQRKLADMFNTFAASGVSYLIETHSEYLVTRMRLLAAKGLVKSGGLTMVFAEPSPEGMEASTAGILRQEAIYGAGRSDYWPSDFHDDAIEDRFELSAIQLMEEQT